MKNLLLFVILLSIAGCINKPVEQALEIREPEEKPSSEPKITEPEVVETPEVQVVETGTKVKVIEPEPICLIFDDFENSQTSAQKWYAVNDNVMGGRSLGYFEVKNGALNFEGSINTNGGGFSSIRSGLPREILSEYQRVVLQVRGDGRNYEVTFRDTNRSRITHRQNFIPTSNTDWQEVSIGFDDLTQAFFGRRVQSPPFDKNQALEIGLILSDGQDGPFSLEVDSISFCK